MCIAFGGENLGVEAHAPDEQPIECKDSNLEREKTALISEQIFSPRERHNRPSRTL